MIYYGKTYLVDKFHAIYEGEPSAVVRVGERHEVHPGGSDRDPASEHVELSICDPRNNPIGGHRAVRNGNVVRESQPSREDLAILLSRKNGKKGAKTIASLGAGQGGSDRG